MRRAVRVAATAVAAIVAGWVLMVIAVIVAGRKDQRTPADAIIVLGAAQYVGHPSPVLQARLDHAADLWRTHVAPVVVVTGGVGDGDTMSEADVGRRYLVSQGIPDSAILMERAGRTTGQSMRAAAAILHEHQLYSAVLVSDPFHALRLRVLAARNGIRGVTSPTRTSPIARNARQEWRYVFSETVKLPVALISPGQ